MPPVQGGRGRQARLTPDRRTPRRSPNPAHPPGHRRGRDRGSTRLTGRRFAAPGGHFARIGAIDELVDDVVCAVSTNSSTTSCAQCRRTRPHYRRTRTVDELALSTNSSTNQRIPVFGSRAPGAVSRWRSHRSGAESLWALTHSGHSHSRRDERPAGQRWSPLLLRLLCLPSVGSPSVSSAAWWTAPGRSPSSARRGRGCGTGSLLRDPRIRRTGAGRCPAIVVVELVQLTTRKRMPSWSRSRCRAQPGSPRAAVHKKKCS